MERAEAEAILDGDRNMAVVLLMQAAELVEANRRLESRIADLEQRLSRDSHNSSLPPSADAGKSRPLLPLEQVDEVVDHWPQRC
ncbi:MAG TPA: DUF6444 domain-containing protein, partial [Coriobacteriia bacterium]|nr:DUF6444 domain-containing protein [Coriobacteriia bacterium]